MGSDSLFVGVLHDEVLWKNRTPACWGRRQPDDECVEVVKNLSPQPVDGAMALVHDDEVEELDGMAGYRRRSGIRS